MAFSSLAIGCGGGEPPARDPHAPYRAIQRDEAVIERSRAAHASSAIPCETRCAAPGDACSASDRICGLAEDLEESDAASRCDAARRACSDLRASTAPTGCTCTRPGTSRAADVERNL